MRDTMRRALLTVAACVLFAGAAAGHTPHTTYEQPNDIDPGLIDATSPLYELEVASDQAALALGIADRGDILQERAAEAHNAAAANDTDAAQRAVDELNSVTQTATSDDTDGLEKAQAVLETVRNRGPRDADLGIAAALDAVEAAKDRKPANPDDAAGNTPGSRGV